MTKKDFEKIGKRLLPQLPGFIAKGDLLFILPLRHTLRGFFFDGSSFDKNLFFVYVFLQPLFVPDTYISLNIGWRVGGESHTWDINSPDLLTELGLSLKREALPFLLRIESPKEVADAVMALRISADPYVQQAIAYSFARAKEVSKATAAIDQLFHLLDMKESYPWQREMAERAEKLKAQLIADPEDAQHQLDVWESETVKNLKLEKFR
jgi:hypothetical protein